MPATDALVALRRRMASNSLTGSPNRRSSCVVHCACEGKTARDLGDWVILRSLAHPFGWDVPRTRAIQARSGDVTKTRAGGELPIAQRHAVGVSRSIVGRYARKTSRGSVHSSESESKHCHSGRAPPWARWSEPDRCGYAPVTGARFRRRATTSTPQRRPSTRALCESASGTSRQRMQKSGRPTPYTLPLGRISASANRMSVCPHLVCAAPALRPHIAPEVIRTVFETRAPRKQQRSCPHPHAAVAATANGQRSRYMRHGNPFDDPPGRARAPEACAWLVLRSARLALRCRPGNPRLDGIRQAPPQPRQARLSREPRILVPRTRLRCRPRGSSAAPVWRRLIRPPMFSRP